MSLPKEPRQKMINMMYLVLTALLALNVSAEILNAFKVVNRSIANSNTVLTTENGHIYTSLNSKLNTNETKEKASIWAPKAFAIQKESDAIYSTIEAYKTRLLKESGYDLAKGDTSSYNPADLDAATRIFDEEGEGPKLYNLLTNYKTQILSDPALAKEFQDKLPLDLSVPPTQEGITPTGDIARNWTVNYFNMTPTVAVVTILSKFQNDIKNSENTLITYCHNQIGAVEVRYDKTGVIAGANATYLMPGDKLSIYAGIGAFSSGAHPTITINGETREVDPEGKATKDITVGGSGPQTVRIGGSYKDQDGKTIQINQEVKYTVGVPSGVAVSADKMNVLYIMGDQPNPLTITGGSGSEKVQASFAGGNSVGTLKHIGGSKWEAYPVTRGEQTINVTIDGKTTPTKWRIKPLPDPTAFIGLHKGGSLSAAEFKASLGLITRLENSEFEAAFKIISYRLGAIGGGIPIYTQAINEGNRWTGKASDIVNRVTPGTQVFFDDITVVGPDGKQRQIQGIFFNLK
ncbi:MAG TPA: GldM family protein [Puia sp.]|jgi:gliding motility-associated protein GldM|nr:GldM family protein [Puia sp.]